MTSLASQQELNALAQTTVLGAIQVLAVSGMSGFIAAAAAAGASIESEASLTEETYDNAGIRV